jgi:protein disulfide-isomerase A6
VIALADGPVDGLTEAYTKLMARPPPHTFQVFKADSTDEVAKSLLGGLELGSELPQFVALHHRGWFRRFAGDVTKPSEILAWLDAVKMGEGQKGKIPEALMGVEEEEKEPSVEKVEEAEEKKDGVKDEL